MLTKRQLKLVDILKNIDEYKTVAYLASLLGVSERTLHSEIKILEYNGWNIHKQRGKGIKMIIEGAPCGRLSEWKMDNILARRMEIIKRLVFKQEKVTFAGLAEEFYTSTTSIQNDIHFIETILFRGESTSLKSNRFGTRFIPRNTQEWINVMVNVNSFIIEETVSGHKNEGHEIDVLKDFYPEQVIIVCKNILYSFVKENVNTISDTYVENFLRHLIATIYLLTKDKHLLLTKKFIDNYKHAFYIDSAVKILHKASLRLGFKYTNDDVQYLSLLLLNYRFEQLPQEAVDESIVFDMVRYTSQAMNIDFMKDSQLIAQLKNHIPAMLSRLRHQTLVKNPFTDQIKLEYSITYNVLWMVAENLFKGSINSDEIAFLTLYFQLSLEKMGAGRKILVICPTGIVTSELLINRIKTLSPSLDMIEVASASEALELSLEEYDLILSTVKVDKKIKNVHIVSPLISNEELNRLFIKNQTESIKKSDFSFFKKYLFKELFISNMKANSKEEVFRFVSQTFVEKEFVNEDFLQSIQEREALGGTDLPVGVAIPHGKTTNINQSFVSIVLLDKKIVWEEYKVNVIVFVGISKEDIKETKKIISNIYRIIHDPMLLNTLKKIQSFEEVVNLLC